MLTSFIRTALIAKRARFSSMLENFVVKAVEARMRTERVSQRDFTSLAVYSFGSAGSGPRVQLVDLRDDYHGANARYPRGLHTL